MRFKLWVENEYESQMANNTPASAEVIKTGLQPQVDSKEIKTRQKEENDKMMAIDSHMQRIATILPSINSMDHESEKLEKIGNFVKEMLRSWEKLKTDAPNDSVGDDPWGFNPGKADWMRQNQPLPEEPRTSDHPTAF